MTPHDHRATLRPSNALNLKGIGRLRAALLLLFAVGAWIGSRSAQAEPYLAVMQGYKCIQCHINPTGGGLRNSFGLVFAENVMPMQTLPQGSPVWLGQAVQDIVRVGGDLRFQYFDQATPHEASQNEFQLEQLRLYADVTVIPNLVGIYVDEQVAPGGAQNEEAYVRIGSQSSFYMKAGQFYLPFGWRLEDQTALVRNATLISMALPDKGVEFGMERGQWSTQLDVTQGFLNSSHASGYQVTGNAVRTESSWRVGASAAFTQSTLGDRNQAGLYAGLRTGPIAWLTEVDLIHQSGPPAGVQGIFGPIATGTQIPALVEANWIFHKGNNLKLTYEYYDPNRTATVNGQQRFSLVYELTPFPFFQVRAGIRRSDGPQLNDFDNLTLTFVELHGFL
jgi:hypothetical protein